MIRVRVETGIIDPGDLGLLFEPLGQFQCILGVPGHSQMQRLEPLEEQEGVERRHAASHVTKELGSGFDDVRQRAEGFDVFDAVIARVRLSQFRILSVRPVEFSRIDNRPTDTGPVPADELRAAMHDNIDAMLDRPQEYRCRNRIVADDRYLVFVGDIRYLVVPQYVVFGITDGFDVDQARIVFDRFGEVFRISRIHKSDFDTKLGECVAEKCHGPAVERIRGDDMTAGPANVEDAHVDRGLARTQRQTAHPAFQSRQPLLEHVGRRIHQSRINISEFLQRKQIRRMVRIPECVTGRLIDRDCSA